MRSSPFPLFLAVVAFSHCCSTCHGLNLGRLVQRGTTSRKVSFLPRSYRLMDEDEEVGRKRFRLRQLKRKNKNIKNIKPSAPKSSSNQEHLQAFLTADHQAKKTKRRKTASSASSSSRVIHNVTDLRSAILDDGLSLHQTELQGPFEANLQVEQLLTHPVVALLASRFHSNSLPGRRADNATLALSLEGGGMRGAVSAGMASAIACLGLCDAFDAVYGSSAGSVVGAYMVSRQFCVDVYTEVLTAAQRTFVCKKRMLKSLGASAVDLLLPVSGTHKWGARASPGMNISFLLDGIMDEQHGLRPLDMEAFRVNDARQPLRIATSCVKNGTLFAKCFGTNDFFGYVDEATNQTLSRTVRADGLREGLLACMEASVTVPGATGPPVLLVDGNNVTTPSFDAFCFEPLPYRSAVEEGATHVLVLRSRPEGFQPKTKPGVYEKGVAPLYFWSHGERNVARFFDRGGQQYIYLEDLLTLEEGRRAGIQKNNAGENGIPVPPTNILYGVELDERTKHLATHRDEWPRAHLLPLTVGKDVPELDTLEQGKDQVIEAVRDGFAAAFDLLAPAIGLELEEGMSGRRVAELVFPNIQDLTLEQVMKQQVQITGTPIMEHVSSQQEEGTRKRRLSFGRGSVRTFLRNRMATEQRSSSVSAQPQKKMAMKKEENNSYSQRTQERCPRRDSLTLLSSLPGFQRCHFHSLAKGLLHHQENV